jgi:hypothetical protein
MKEKKAWGVWIYANGVVGPVRVTNVDPECGVRCPWFTRDEKHEAMNDRMGWAGSNDPYWGFFASEDKAEANKVARGARAALRAVYEQLNVMPDDGRTI